MGIDRNDDGRELDQSEEVKEKGNYKGQRMLNK